VAVYLPPWRIDVQSQPGVPRVVPTRALARTVAATLSVAGAPRPASIGLILSEDHELAELNAAHLGHDGPTDVLSFPLLPPVAFPVHVGQDPRRRAAARDFALPPGSRVHLGDIVVSVERAIEQASEGRGGQAGDIRWSPGDELRLLVTHGTLHICGWDHAERAEEAAMRTVEQGLLASYR
jgi:probable rRNA maturation factor